MVHQNPTKKLSSSPSFNSIYSDKQIVDCFVGSIVKRGNKQKAVKFFYFLLYSIRKIYGVEGLKFLRLLIESLRPKIFLSSKKVAGVIHKIPTPITTKKSYSIAIHWILVSARKRTPSSGLFQNALLDEINDIYKNSSNATLKKRDEFHKMAYINKPFLRFYKFLLLFSK